MRMDPTGVNGSYREKKGVLQVRTDPTSVNSPTAENVSYI